MASEYKKHTSYLILDQVCSHVYSHSLTKSEHDSVLDIFKSKGGDWKEVTNGNPEQMQKLISSLKQFMKNKKAQKRVQ